MGYFMQFAQACQDSLITHEPGWFLANGMPQSSLLTQPGSLRTEFNMRGFQSCNWNVVCPLQTTGNHCGYHQKTFCVSQSLLPWPLGKWDSHWLRLQLYSWNPFGKDQGSFIFTCTWGYTSSLLAFPLPPLTTAVTSPFLSVSWPTVHQASLATCLYDTHSPGG